MMLLGIHMSNPWLCHIAVQRAVENFIVLRIHSLYLATVLFKKSLSIKRLNPQYNCHNNPQKHFNLRDLSKNFLESVMTGMTFRN